MKPSSSPKPLTGRKVLFMLVAFFGVVIGVNLVMMRFAIQTLPGTEVDSAYSASLAYEKEIATARDQGARNWKVDAHVERSGQGGAMLQVEARDNFGRPMSGLAFQGRFERPTDRRADQPVTLAEVGIGIYRGSASAIAPGQWDLGAGRRRGRTAIVPVQEPRVVELGHDPDRDGRVRAKWKPVFGKIMLKQAETASCRRRETFHTMSVISARACRISIWP